MITEDIAKGSGARHLLGALASGGCERLFMVPGSSMVSVLHELRSAQISAVPALHESVAVAMADGYSRLRGISPVAVYMAPGTANAMANLYNAWCDESPLLVLASQQRLSARSASNASVGEADLVGMAAQWTRFRWEVTAPEALPRALSLAARAAMGPPGGPAFLSLPQDVLESDVRADPVPWSSSRASSDVENLEPLVSALRQAERPLIVAGGQVQRTGGENALVELAELLSAPVLYEPFWSDRLPISPGHRLALGELTERSSVAQSADVVLAVGCRLFREIHPRVDPWFPAASFVAHINMDRDKLLSESVPDLSLAADPGRLLAKLTRLLSGLPAASTVTAEREQRLEDILGRRQARAASERRQIVAGLSGALEAGYVVDESVSASNDLVASLTHGPAKNYFCNSGGSLGWGMGAACGIALAHGTPVTCVLGDGAFYFGIHALWNAVAQSLPILFVVLDNGGFGSTRYFEDLYASTRTTSDLTLAPYIASDFRTERPSIVDVARSFGVAAQHVTDPLSLAAEFERSVVDLVSPRLLHVEVPF